MRERERELTRCEILIQRIIKSSIKIHVFVISPKESQTVRTVCFTPVHFLPIQTVEPLKPSTD